MSQVLLSNFNFLVYNSIIFLLLFLVTGKINLVQDTKYDFCDLVKLGDRIKSNGEWPAEGYDNFFVVSGEGNGLKKVAT